jgi:HK97 family phage portal protein
VSAVGRIAGRLLLPLGQRLASTLAKPEGWFRSWSVNGGGGYSDDDAVAVNEITALNYSAVFSCVSLIAGAIAGLPLPVYRKTANGKEEAADNPAWDVLQREFNPGMSALTAREAGIAHLLTWGNSYARIISKRNGDLVELRTLAPDIVRPRLSSGEIVYDIFNRKSGQVAETLLAGEVLHVPGLGFDGYVGYSPITISKTAIRSGMAQDREAERFITRGVRPPGALKLPAGKKFANAQEAKEFRERWEATHNGAASGQKILILEDGREWESLGVDPVAAQLLESRKFSRSEVAGIYRVPPFMIGDVEKTTSWGTGVEEQGVNFVKYTLLNWIRRIEAEYNRKLFTKESGFYCKHNVEGLLRGDMLKRSQALEVQHRRGIITDNEWRELEDYNPVEGGDVRHFPLAEGRVDDDGEDIAPPASVPNKNDNPNKTPPVMSPDPEDSIDPEEELP